MKDITGDHPGIYGWEIGHIENGAAVNLDSVLFENMKKQQSRRIQTAFSLFG